LKFTVPWGFGINTNKTHLTSLRKQGSGSVLVQTKAVINQESTALIMTGLVYSSLLKPAFSICLVLNSNSSNPPLKEKTNIMMKYLINQEENLSKSVEISDKIETDVKNTGLWFPLSCVATKIAYSLC
jgi:hypothetical protein